MKILLSPSKKKEKNEHITEQENVFVNKTQNIVKYMKNLEKDIYNQVYKKKSEDVQEFYRNYATRVGYEAIYTYRGLVYLKLDPETLDKNKLNNIYILSALYGILKPFDMIKLYRLDFNDKIGITLPNYWINCINEYLEKEDILINLASEEYTKNIKHKNMYKIEFYRYRNGKYSQSSTDVKMKRGLMARKIIEENISDIETIKKIVIDGYKYNDDKSGKHILRFYEIR